MKISIITVCYNSQKYIQSAVESLIQQDYQNIEYIIVDGKSSDNTLNILNQYKNDISLIVSEPDSGIYEAMNKGIKLATGDIIGFLNSDDFYAEKGILTNIAGSFQQNNVDCVFGNINYVKPDNVEKTIRKWNSGSFKRNSFQQGWHPAHPAFFVKRNVYEKFGGFNLEYKLAADFELMLRFLEKEQISNLYLEKTIIHMRLGGATSSNLKNSLKQNLECYKSFKDNKIPVSPLYPFLRLIPKLKQFFK